MLKIKKCRKLTTKLIFMNNSCKIQWVSEVVRIQTRVFGMKILPNFPCADPSFAKALKKLQLQCFIYDLVV